MLYFSNKKVATHEDLYLQPISSDLFFFIDAAALLLLYFTMGSFKMQQQPIHLSPTFLTSNNQSFAQFCMICSTTNCRQPLCPQSSRRSTSRHSTFRHAPTSCRKRHGWRRHALVQRMARLPCVSQTLCLLTAFWQKLNNFSFSTVTPGPAHVQTCPIKVHHNKTWASGEVEREGGSWTISGG